MTRLFDRFNYTPHNLILEMILIDDSPAWKCVDCGFSQAWKINQCRLNPWISKEYKDFQYLGNFDKQYNFEKLYLKLSS